MKKVVMGLGFSLSLLACPGAPVAPKCDVPVTVDSGTSVDSGIQVDSGVPVVDAGNPITEESVQFVNATSNTLTFTVDDAGVVVEPFSSSKKTHNKTGHVTLNRRTISVSAGGPSVSFDCDFDRHDLDGERLPFSCVAVAHESISTAGLVMRKGWDGTVKGGSRVEKSFTERITESLEASATALDIGIDMTGDCKADVGARKGADTTYAVFTDDNAPVCANEGVLAFRVVSSINGEEVEDVSFVKDGAQPVMGYRHHAKLAKESHGKFRLGAPVPDVFVMHVRTTRVNEDYTYNGRPLATALQPGRTNQLPIPVAYAVLKNRTKSNNTNERISVGTTMLPLISEIGPCKPPYLCGDEDEFVAGRTRGKAMLSDFSFHRSSALLLVSDTDARLIDLPNVAAVVSKMDTPYMLPIVVGPARTHTSVCFGSDTGCLSRDGVSFDVDDNQVAPRIAQPARMLPVLRNGITTRPQFRVTDHGASQGAPESTQFSQPLTLPSTSTILVVGSALMFEPNALPDVKVVIQISNSAKKDYVGHVTLIKQ